MEKDSRLSAEQLDQLAIIPLPNTVFFPHTLLPLHIFEPRYKALVAEALEHDLPIAVALMKSSGGEHDTGREPFHRMACVGGIVRAQELDDGRYNILLRGLGRVSVVVELETDKPYRVVRARWRDDEWRDDERIREQVERINACVFSLVSSAPKLGGTLAKMAGGIREVAPLTDALSSVLFPDLPIRQRLLDETDVERRCEMLLARLTDLLVGMDADEEVDPSELN